MFQKRTALAAAVMGRPVSLRRPHAENFVRRATRTAAGHFRKEDSGALWVAPPMTATALDQRTNRITVLF